MSIVELSFGINISDAVAPLNVLAAKLNDCAVRLSAEY